MGKLRHGEEKGQVAGRIRLSHVFFPNPCWLIPLSPEALVHEFVDAGVGLEMEWGPLGISWTSLGSAEGSISQRVRGPGTMRIEDSGPAPPPPSHLPGAACLRPSYAGFPYLHRTLSSSPSPDGYTHVPNLCVSSDCRKQLSNYPDLHPAHRDGAQRGKWSSKIASP